MLHLFVTILLTTPSEATTPAPSRHTTRSFGERSCSGCARYSERPSRRQATGTSSGGSARRPAGTSPLRRWPLARPSCDDDSVDAPCCVAAVLGGKMGAAGAAVMCPNPPATPMLHTSGASGGAALFVLGHMET